jgi:hypothetical protein
MGYTSSLLQQMEATKRRLAGGLMAQPDAFQLPQTDVPLPQGQPMPQPALPVAAPQIDNAHQHRKGPLGLLSHIIGADRIRPELAALLTPDQQKRATPGLVASLFGFIAQGKTPNAIATERANQMMRLENIKTKRDQQAALANLQSAFIPRIMAARTPDERYEAMAQFSAARAAILGPEAMGTAPNMLQALEPTVQKASGPIPNQSWIPDPTAPGGYRQLGTPSQGPRYETFDGFRQVSTDGGKTWTKLGKAGEAERPRKQLIQVPNADGTMTYRWITEGEEVTGVQKQTAARGRAIAEVLPTITSTVERLRKFTGDDIKKLSATGVNAASIANKTADSYGGMIGAAIANATVVSAPDRAYAQMVRAIGDAVARANEVGILTNQDIMRYESQVSFVSGDDEGMKRQKVNNAIAWADWLQRNKSALVPGGKPSKMPGESDAEYQQRTGGQPKSGGRNPWR